MAMHAIGSFGSLFLRGPNDLKGWRQRAQSFKALGHLGHFVMPQKLAPGDALSTMHGFIGINPNIKIFYFLN
jgi:hypothetical protein